MKFINRLISTFTLGGKMSEAGADKAGNNISTGIKFFFCCSGVALLVVAVAFGYHLIK